MSIVMKLLTAIACAACLAACATSAPAPQTPTGAGGPAGALDLGDYRRASPGNVAENFSDAVARRYAAGSPVAAAQRDLERNEFACTSGSGRGAPAQVCRRTLRAENCEHIWRVHLYSEARGLARTRALYDRTCGNDRLLGG